MLDRLDALSIDLRGHRPLEQIHGNDDAEVIMARAHNEAFNASERPTLYAYALAGMEVGPRRKQGMGGGQLLQIFNLTILHGSGRVANSHNLLDAWRLQNTDVVIGLKADEDIAWKNWLIDDFYAIRPVPLGAAERQVVFHSTTGQFRRSLEFPSGGCSNGKPTHSWRRAFDLSIRYFQESAACQDEAMLRTTAENHTSDSIAALLLEVAHNSLKSRYGVSTADLYVATTCEQ